MSKKKKNKPIFCSDANEHIVNHNKMIKRKNDYLIRKIAEYRAKQMMAQQNPTNDTASETVDGMK